MTQTSEASGAILGELFTPEDETGEVKRVEEGDSLLPRPPSAREGPSFWKSDVAFGRQFTQGIHCTMLEVCREVPPELVYGLPLTSIRFRTAYTLADEAKDGRVYKVDYRCAGCAGCLPGLPAWFARQQGSSMTVLVKHGPNHACHVACLRAH